MTSTTSVSRDPVAPWKLWTGRVLSVLPGLAFLPSAAMKLMQKPEFLTAWTGTFGYPAGTATPIGIIELACLASSVRSCSPATSAAPSRPTFAPGNRS
jgi:hypothetical protein